MQVNKSRFRSYRTLHCKSQKKLYNSLKKHTPLKHIFEIICECTVKDIYEKEHYYGTLFNVLGKDGLNSCLPKVDDSFCPMSDDLRLHMRNVNLGKRIGTKLSPETKEKIRLAGIGRVQTPETREKLRIKHTGKKLSTEHIEKMRKSKTGVKMSPAALEKARNRVITPETRLKISIAGKGKKRSAEFCERLSKVNTGKKHSAETRQKISDAQGNRIINILTGELFNSTRSASKKLGMGKNYICQKQARGASIFPMMYIKDFIQLLQNNGYIGNLSYHRPELVNLCFAPLLLDVA